MKIRFQRQKDLSLLDRSVILIKLTMHMPVQPLDHRRSSLWAEVVRPTMLGESSQKYGETQKYIGGA